VEVSSIPNVSFVPFQIVSPQELTELVLKRYGAMVLFLVRQIRLNLVDFQKFARVQEIARPSLPPIEERHDDCTPREVLQL
jgi:hypothetical protein